MRLILLLLPILLLSDTNTDDSFLLEIEYGKMLYNNPRGIACSKCHGKEGKGGQVISKYYDKNSNPKLLKGIDITHYSFEQLKLSLENKFRDEKNHRVRHKIMPIYYLTDQEIKAIHTYLKSVRDK
ncbi:MAG TPA: c-type cytochrome [Campylobacterales bacterium]|jgi:mono/diheme cytochrome c family protein|nr:c-type cytochrome [Campylobacterales bacterium]HHC11214.1 c-type cytochrome [Campylobacterales bacterium]HHD80442.1 c-type cytochrome [Campylobacterales bacterium]